MEQSTPFSTKSIKLVVHDGRICGKFDQSLLERLANLGLGTWHIGWSCWTFKLDGYTAWRLIKEFKQEIESCATEIKDLAIGYNSKQEVKTAEGLEDIPGLKRSAWGHQRQGYHFAYDLEAVMLAMGMGCGKTLTAIGLLQNRKHNTCLILCPKSVIPVWPLEFERNATEDFYIVKAETGDGLKKRMAAENGLKAAAAHKKPFVYIINYESAWRDPIASWIKKQKWDHIIFDECHRIKAAAGKASRFCGTLLQNSRYRIGLTGTPMPHSPLDLYAQYRALDTKVFGTSNAAFKRRYAEYGGFNGLQVTKFINQEEMAFKFERIAFRVTSEILDLPPVTHTRKVCTLEPAAMKAYMQMEDEMYFEMLEGEVTAANALVKILRLQQITSGYIKNDDGTFVKISDSKQALLQDTLEDIDADEPIVIFAVFKTDIKAIREELVKAKRSVAELSGSRNDLAEWQEGKYNAIVVQIRSGGVGVDLTRSCIQLYYSTSHSMGDYEQSIARTHRPGQTRPVRFIHLTAQGTIDEAIYAALEKKKQAVDLVLEYVKRRREGGH